MCLTAEMFSGKEWGKVKVRPKMVETPILCAETGLFRFVFPIIINSL